MTRHGTPPLPRGERGRRGSTAPARHLQRALLVLGCVVVMLAWSATPALAAPGDIGSVIDSIRTWITGLLAALATLFLTIGGVRYLLAGGNVRAAEEGKSAMRSALIGFAIAAMAPLFVDVVKRVLGI